MGQGPVLFVTLVPFILNPWYTWYFDSPARLLVQLPAPHDGPDPPYDQRGGDYLQNTHHQRFAVNFEDRTYYRPHTGREYVDDEEDEPDQFRYQRRIDERPLVDRHAATAGVLC